MSTNHRAAKRQPVEIDGMIYDHHGKQLAHCMIRNISVGGAQLGLMQEAEIPETFLLALSHDGHVLRHCHKVWQFATVLGVKFSPKEVQEHGEVQR
jgi:hypothetical protein